MTNEELAMKAKDGDEDAIAELWENVKKVCFKKANCFFNSYKKRCASCGVDLDDCQQSTFFAMLDAVRGFNSESGWNFTAFLNFPLKNRFDELIGNRGNLAPRLLNHSLSLDLPVANENGDVLALGNIIPDAEAEESYASIDNRLYLQQLLATITEQQREVIVLDFFYGFTQEEIAKRLGVSRCYVSKLKLTALENMKSAAEKKVPEMAKEWAKPFYRSAAWQAVRRQALRRDAFTCAFCGNRATEVHHIRELTQENIGDPNIALNIDNLQCLCHKCHTTLTMAEHGRKNIDCDMPYYFDENGQLVKFRK